MVRSWQRGWGSLLLVAVGATAVLTGSVSASPPAESAVVGWPRQFGTSGFEFSGGVTVSGSGDVFVAGSTAGAFPGNTNQGLSDAFVARYDKFGKLVWIRQFGTAGHDTPGGIALSGSSIYITGIAGGTFTGATSAGGADGFVARYSTSGTQSWVRQFGTAGDDEPNGVAVSGGAVYVTGRTDGTFAGETSAGDDDGFLARYSSSGTQVWLDQFGTAAFEEATALAVSGGAIYVTGRTDGAFPGETSVGNDDGFLVRYSGSGTQVWVDQFGSTADDRPAGLAALSGALYVTGATQGTFPTQTSAGGFDGFLVRYSNSGTQAWVRQFGTAAQDRASAVAGSGGALYVTGFTQGSFPGFVNVGETDGFLARYSSAGTATWARQFGTTVDDFPEDVAVRSSDSFGGGVVVAGATEGTVWGQASGGDDDAFVATFLK